MSVASQSKIIDELIGKAARAVTRKQHFEAERTAVKALYLARDESDFDRMASIIPTLAEARQGRLNQAIDVNRITVVDTPVTEETRIEPGCYLVQPPLVGADARRLRMGAVSRDIPVAVLCREPLVKIGMWPIVAIAPGVTVRMKIEPADDQEKPDMDWFLDAMEALGDAVLEGLDPDQAIVKRVDALLTRLDAVPDHLELHQCLLESCEAAAEQSLRDRDAGEPQQES